MPRLSIALATAVLLAACGAAGPDTSSEAGDVPTSTTTVPAVDAPAATASPSGGESVSPAPTEQSGPDLDQVELAYEVIAEGFEAPVLVLPRPGTQELWVVEQPGRIRSFVPGTGFDEVADLTNLVHFGGERGLLGLAFSPDHPQTGEFVVHYSSVAGDGDTRIERWRMVPQVGAERGSVVLEVPQPASNHNGGMIQFGPDGMLYVALGDGGRANDDFGNGQRPDTLLGAILRLDLRQEPYAIPVDNPFVDGVTAGGEPAAPEVWVWGLRNPWRTWIDAPAGGTPLLYIGDVGQGRIEEVDVIGLDAGGANLGWPIREGSGCLGADGCRSQGLVMPIAEYGHDNGECSITGGVVNRGPAAPSLAGHWFYSDFCAGFLRSLRVTSAGSATDLRDWTDQVGVVGQVTSFGVDHDGNVLVVSADGRIRRLVERG